MTPLGRTGARLVIAAALFAAAAGGAASPSDGRGSRWSALVQPTFANFGPDDGLPQETVTSIAEDGQGFLWFGTADGLARWDGYHFRSYRPAPGVAGSLPDNYILRLFADRQGRLWIGTAAGGIARYGADCDCFEHPAAATASSGSAQIEAFADDGAGGIWAGTDAGLEHRAGDGSLIARFDHEGEDAARLPSDRIRSLLLDGSGRLWVGTRSGLFHRDTPEQPFVPAAFPSESASQLNISSLFEDRTGAIWIGTATAGAYRIDAGKSVARPVTGAGLETQWVYAIEEAKPGEIWLGTHGQGIVTLDQTSGEIFRMRHQAARQSSLASDRVWALHRDRSGMMWVGSGIGVGRTMIQTGIVSIHGGADIPGGLHGTDLTAVLARRDGTLWLGLGDNGIDIVAPRRGVVARVSPNPLLPDTALPNKSIAGLVEGNDGTVWIGTDGGLYRADSPGQHVRRIGIPGAAPDMGIGALLMDGDRLWVGSTAEGLWSIDLRNGAVLDRYSTPALPDSEIMVLAKAPDGVLWVGTANGLARLDTASGKTEVIAADPADAGKISAGLVSTLLIDRKGRVWVGTQGGGIDLLDHRAPDGRPVFRRIRLSDGLPSGNIDWLAEDNDGTVWASTDGGIASLSGDPPAIRSYRRAEGVAFHGYWGNSGAKTAEGDLLFGGSGGLTLVEPGKVARWSYDPPIVLTDLKVGGQPAAPARFGAGRPIPITPSANSIVAEFAALDFSAPERNQYSYRLEGYDKDWIRTGPDRRIAAYTNLPPGDYTLALRGSNRDGVWTRAALELPVKVLPAWHQTWWARGGVALALLALLLGIVRARTAQLHHRQKWLEELVTERTDQLAQSARQADLLLENILPRHVIDELGLTGKVDPIRHDGASILFTDLVGFTQAASTMPADRMVSELNAIFAAFDDIAEREGIEKIKTIGDAYMAVAGLAEQEDDHAHRCVRAALAMLAFLEARNGEASFKWNIRVGIHSGPVVAGVVGRRKYAFDVWGDAVNMAARMESAGEPGRINVSAYTYDLIRQDFDCIYRGKQVARGKGEVDMYFVTCAREGAEEA